MARAHDAAPLTAALSLVYNLIIIIVCWIFYTVMTNAGAERRPEKPEKPEKGVA